MWYMHNPESVMETETHQLLQDFEIQTDHLTSANKKRTSQIVDFDVLVYQTVKIIKNENKEKWKER